MNHTELKAIEERADAATRGPWRWHAPQDESQEDRSDRWRNCTELPAMQGSADVRVCDFGDERQYYPSAGNPPSADDAAFIAAAREDVPALIAEVKRLREQRDEARKQARHNAHVGGAIYVNDDWVDMITRWSAEEAAERGEGR